MTQILLYIVLGLIAGVASGFLGIGGGIIQDGNILRGAYENAAEIGHMIVQPNGRICNCGQRGCLEAYASASNTAKIAIEAIQSGTQSSLKNALDTEGTITSRTIVQHMQNGDKLAGDIWQQTCRYLAIGCINIAHIINCQMIVLSGGMTEAGEQLLKPVQKYYQQLRWNIDSQMQTYPPIVLAKLGNDAGLIGAAGAAMLHLKKQRPNGS